jgi:FHS family L-fucose permease-like MFS transporter
MIATSESGPSAAETKPLFRLPDGRNMVMTFILATTLFFLWGFCNGMIDVLNKHFQNTLQITKAQSGFVQFSNYLAYFLMAVPAGLLARRFGYKGGILIGLSLIAGGAFWFIPATRIGTYWAFLTGLFIIASGMTCLETIANPYTTLLGPSASGATRINIAQTINGIGWVLGPLIGGSLIFGGGETAAKGNGNLYLPYLGIGVAVTFLLVVFGFSTVPDLQAEDEVKAEEQGRGHKPLWRRGHFVGGVLAQFFYVAAQAGVFSFFINYVTETNPGVSEKQASAWLGLFGFGLFMLGRLCGSAVVSLMKPQRALTLYAIINVGLTALAMTSRGKPGLVGLLGTFFFMSIMFPTIFALGIRGLGSHTKLASSVIVMSIVGGAIAPPMMGHIADISSMRIGFGIPLVCFALVAAYGAVWQALEARDRGA